MHVIAWRLEGFSPSPRLSPEQGTSQGRARIPWSYRDGCPKLNPSEYRVTLGSFKRRDRTAPNRGHESRSQHRRVETKPGRNTETTIAPRKGQNRQETQAGTQKHISLKTATGDTDTIILLLYYIVCLIYNPKTTQGTHIYGTLKFYYLNRTYCSIEKVVDFNAAGVL